MIRQLDSMFTHNICNTLFPDRDMAYMGNGDYMTSNDIRATDGVPFLVTKIQEGVFYLPGEWGIKVEYVQPLLDTIKEHVSLLHNNKIFIKVDCYPKLDDNGFPEIEIYCRYKFKRDDVYVEKVDTFEPSPSPIDKKKYKIKNKGKR